jgi:putative membrane protein
MPQSGRFASRGGGTSHQAALRPRRSGVRKQDAMKVFNDLSHADQLASMRTELSYHRNRLAADRTMMAIMRTSLSLIGFGFTIYTFFTNFITGASSRGILPPQAPTRFGLALILIGVALLVLGIIGDYRYMQRIKAQRALLVARGMLPVEPEFPRSLSLLMAIAVLLFGVVVFFSIILRVWPFG